MKTMISSSTLLRFCILSVGYWVACSGWMASSRPTTVSVGQHSFPQATTVERDPFGILPRRETTCLFGAGSRNDNEAREVASSSSRRSLLKKWTVDSATTVVASLVFAVTSTSTPAHADTGAEVRGTPVNALNGLAFQYRGSDFNGLSAADVAASGEPSISYADFVARLKAGEVEFVEFLAPDGDAAYVTFKKNGSKPIRIGEGYPIEQHDGYSSPAFAIRTVKNAGVPYKFIVPALSQYRSTTAAKTN